MTIDDNIGATPDEKLKSLKVSYNINKTSINTIYSQIENDDFTRGNDVSHIDLEILFNF